MTKIEYYPAPPYFLTIRHGENWVHLPWITRRDVERLLGPTACLVSPSSEAMRAVIINYMLEMGISPELAREAFVQLVKYGRFEKDGG